MKRFSVHFVVSIAVFNVVINAAVVINRSEKDFELPTTKAPESKVQTDDPKHSDLAIRLKKLSRRDRCCNLGKEVAKIGETCTYSPNGDHIYPDSHYHQMKTYVWIRRSHPINRRLLHKCKPFKVFYEKCCHYEYSLITQDLLRAKRKIQQYLREIRKNDAVEDQGSLNEQGGLPEEGNSQKSQLIASQ